MVVVRGSKNVAHAYRIIYDNLYYNSSNIDIDLLIFHA